MTRSTRAAKKNDTHDVVVERERVSVDVHGDPAAEGLEEVTAETPAATATETKRRTQKTPKSSNGTSGKPSTANPAVDHLVEEVTADYQAAHDRLQQVHESVQEVQEQAEALQDAVGRHRAQVQAALILADSLRTEASQVSDLMRGTAREVNTEAGEALQQVRQARQEADLVRYEVGQAQQGSGQIRQLADQARLVADQAWQELEQVRLDTVQARQDLDLILPSVNQVCEQTDQVQRDLDLLRQQQGEAGLKARQALDVAEQTLTQVELAQEHHDEASQQLAEVRRQLVEMRSYLETVRQEWQTSSQTLLDEIQQQRETVRQRGQEANTDIDLAYLEARGQLDDLARQARARLEEIEGQLEHGKKVQQVPAPPPRPVTPAATVPAPAAPQDTTPRADSATGEHREDADVVRAAVRPETPRERVSRHLHETWAVKESVVGALKDMAGEVVDPELRTALDEQRQLTEKQKQELEQRLRGLGIEPVSNKGVLQQLLGWIWGSWKREPDDYDRALQDLEKALTAQQAEVTLAEVLEVLAVAGDDAETAELARRHRAEKQSAVDRLHHLVAPLAELAVRLPASAMLAAHQVLVEAGVIEAPPEPAPAEETTAGLPMTVS